MSVKISGLPAREIFLGEGMKGGGEVTCEEGRS